MHSNWRIGSILGIPLYINYSWFLILALVTIMNAGEVNASGLSSQKPIFGWIAGLIMALLLFASVLLHELGHSLVARSQGIKVNSITLFIFGGVASIDRESKTPPEALRVAIAGPLVSMVLFGLFTVLTQFCPPEGILRLCASDLARINLVIGLFNLIPGLPLDGGQILKAAVWKVTGNRFTGVRIATTTGKILGYLIISVGLLLILLTGEISAVWITLIGWFILRSAYAYEQMNILQETILKLVAADVMTREFRVVNANLSLTDFAKEYVTSDVSGTSSTYYAAALGRYRGLVVVSDLNSIERSQWDTQTLAEIARPLTEIPSVQEKTPLVEVINQLENIAQPRITVLSPAGAVAGVIDKSDIVKAVASEGNLAISVEEIQRVKTEGTYPSGLQLSAIAKVIKE